MSVRGIDILRDPSLTHSTAYTHQDRERLGLRGLLPYGFNGLSQQEERVLQNLRRKENDIEKYIFLSALQDRNETLYYHTALNNIEEVMPLIYTPTVGQACREFAQIFRRPKGFYITPSDRGQISQILENWPEKHVRVVVVTDGQRILGLGDLGANGMGIPIGKLALYTICAGIHPKYCLPVMFDVGTNNEDLLADPLYLGYPEERLEGDAYLELMDEFVAAIREKYGNALIQFEDFLTPNAYKLLNRYRDGVLCFNDDIQGTAAVALAGVMAGAKAANIPFQDLKIMFLGAGSAATGIGDLMARALAAEGLSQDEALSRLWFVDINGLVVEGRDDLQPHNMPYAHKEEQLGFLAAIRKIKPQVLIGATGAPGTFTQDVVRVMAEQNERPIIFALSNPTSRAECTAQQAYEWSEGRALFASGSPFEPVILDDTIYKPGQGNNAYVFPGIGLGALAGKLTLLPEELFLTAARTLADCISEEDLRFGALYPPLTEIRDVSRRIATNVARAGFDMGVSSLSALSEESLDAQMDAEIYLPTYD